MKRILVLLLVLLVGLSSTVVVGETGLENESPNTEGDDLVERKLTSWSGIKYTVTFNKSSRILSVLAKNPRSKKIHTGTAVRVDGRRIGTTSFNLSAGESWSNSWNVTSGFHVHKDEHKITFATFENATNFYVTFPINATDSPNIPSPRITDVRIANGTIEGSPSSVAYVTIENPGNQLYGASLLVHTSGTGGSYYTATTAPNGNRTIKVELLDERGAVIKGEARLYDENMSDASTAYDQVGFVGQAGKNTSMWNETYEPGMPPWAGDPYTYQNESDQQSLVMQASGGQTFHGIPLVYFGGALLGGLVVLKRLA